MQLTFQIMGIPSYFNTLYGLIVDTKLFPSRRFLLVTLAGSETIMNFAIYSDLVNGPDQTLYAMVFLRFFVSTLASVVESLVV